MEVRCGGKRETVVEKELPVSGQDSRSPGVAPGSGGMLPRSPAPEACCLGAPVPCSRRHARPWTRVALGARRRCRQRPGHRLLPLPAEGEGVLLRRDRSPEPPRMSGGGVRERSLRSYHYYCYSLLDA